MYDTKKDVHRGLHAHKKLQQVLFCVSGSCTIRLDDGREKVEVKLNRPEKGLYIGPGIWSRKMKRKISFARYTVHF